MVAGWRLSSEAPPDRHTDDEELFTVDEVDVERRGDAVLPDVVVNSRNRCRAHAKVPKVASPPPGSVSDNNLISTAPAAGVPVEVDRLRSVPS